MKKMFAVLVGASLVLGLVAGPSALAGKKKKKKPVTRTVTFEESGSMKGPAPASIVFFGVTEGEFRVVNECGALPASQGVDGWVIEIPEEFRMGTGSLEVVGTDTTGQMDLDLYFVDASCTVMEPYMTAGANPSGAILPGATHAIIDLFAGANATFDLKATATITQ